MTQSDDNSGRDSSCESKCLEDKLITVQQTVTVGAAEKEVNRGGENDISLENANLGPRGAPNLVNPVEMGSADSAGNTHSNDSTCSFVGALIPSSCRVRAEAFARTLHHRLTSLSGDGVDVSRDDDDDSMSIGGRLSSRKVTETSWLHAPTNSATSLTSQRSIRNEERVLDSQPRHSPESDVYYDFQPCESLKKHDNDEDNTADSSAKIAMYNDVANILLSRKIASFDCCKDRKVTRQAPGQSKHSRDSESDSLFESTTPPEYLQDSESDCLYASPLPDTSPDTDYSETFYDLESSETGETCDNRDNVKTHKDDQSATTDESEKISPRVVTNEGEASSSKIRKHSLRRRNHRVEMSDERQNYDDVDTSESSLSSCNNPDVEVEDCKKNETRRTASSEESINCNKSSPETTTSPSNESLWSTFDESTLSLQDESTNGLRDKNFACQQSKLPKSHSDSEILEYPSRSKNVDEVDCASTVSVKLTNGENEDSFKYEKNDSAHCSFIDFPGALVLEYPSGRRIDNLEMNQINNVDLRIEEPNDTQLRTLIKSVERIACSSVSVDEIAATESPEPTVDVNVEKRAINGTRTNDEAGDKDETIERETESEEKKKKNNDDDDDDDDDDENEKPHRVRRCSSLKTGKTPPGTPGRKKIVRFADVLGLDLADVRTFLDEVPKVPNSAYSDLIYDEAFQKDTSPVNFWGTGPATFTTPLYAATMPRASSKLDRALIPLFPQPGGAPGFLDTVRERLVCLENVVVQDPVNMCLSGTVRVRNLDFHKSVHVRYTLDSWQNFSDLQATYAANSCDGFSDKFTFVLYCHTIKVGQRLELAVRFQCKGSQYWDNNGGTNYCFQCLPATSANSGYVASTAPTLTTTTSSSLIQTGSTHDWSPNFY